MGTKVSGKQLGERYIDRYSYMSGKKFIDGNAPYKLASSSELEKFISIMQISQSYKFYLLSTESSTQFWSACKDISTMFDSKVKEDLFFSVKVGKRYGGVPSKLVYLLQKAKSEWKYPNLSLSAIPQKLLTEFCYEDSLSGVNLHDVICNVWSADVKILSPYRRRAQFGDCVELYVQSDIDLNKVDRVALIPLDINSCIADNEVAAITFDSKKGLMLNDTVVRQLCGYAGITKHDFDLRGVL